MDGNGRLARFLMNAMLASGGYPWTIIHVERRDEYLKALETAHVDRNILPLAKMVSSEMKKKTSQ
jgi:Fic family protein